MAKEVFVDYGRSGMDARQETYSCDHDLFRTSAFFPTALSPRGMVLRSRVLLVRPVLFVRNLSVNHNEFFLCHFIMNLMGTFGELLNENT